MKLRMVDRICGYEPREWITGIKTVSFEEYSLRDALDCEACLPESLLLESMFQLGNWLIMISSDFTQMGMVIRTGKVEFLAPVRPGGQITASVRVTRYRDDGVCFDGQAKVGDLPVARGWSCLAAPAPLDDYCDADDLRVLLSEIYRPRED